MENPPIEKVTVPFSEIAAVLAIGVIPQLLSAVMYLAQPAPPLPFRLDALNLTLLSGCTIVATLYILRTGNLNGTNLGLSRPRAGDVACGAVLLILGLVTFRLSLFVPPSAKPDFRYFPLPAGTVEWLLAVVKYLVAAYAEELVTRVYLITRLSKLFGSQVKAIVVAAALFASYHVYQGPEGFVGSFLFGLVYGAAYGLNRRIWPLVLGHAGYNLLLEYLAD